MKTFPIVILSGGVVAGCATKLKSLDTTFGGK